MSASLWSGTFHHKFHIMIFQSAKIAAKAHQIIKYHSHQKLNFHAHIQQCKYRGVPFMHNNHFPYDAALSLSLSFVAHQTKYQLTEHKVELIISLNDDDGDAVDSACYPPFDGKRHFRCAKHTQHT